MKGRKGSTDEGGVRSPFCIRWPGHIRKGAVETQFSGAIDLIPTLLGLAGIENTPLRKLDGIDWGQRLLDEKAPAMDRVLREESYVKGFAPCSVGTIPLSKGTATLSLQAKTIRNEEAMNFWMLVLKRVK